jgi:hypothetical protein
MERFPHLVIATEYSKVWLVTVRLDGRLYKAHLRLSHEDRLSFGPIYLGPKSLVRTGEAYNRVHHVLSAMLRGVTRTQVEAVTQ